MKARWNDGGAALVAVLGLVSASAFGQPPGLPQELTLFQDDGSGRGPSGGPPANAAPAPTAAALTLKGVYRFGDTYHVTLQNSAGATQNVTWQAGQNGSVAALDGYQVQVVDAKTVTLGLPPGVGCQSATGTSCVGRNQVALSMVQAAPSSRVAQNRNNNGNNNNNNANNAFNASTRAEAWWGDQAGGNAAANIRELIQQNGGDIRALIEREMAARGGQQGNGRGGNQGGGRGGQGGRGGFGNDDGGGRGNANAGNGNTNGNSTNIRGGGGAPRGNFQ